MKCFNIAKLNRTLKKQSIVILVVFKSTQINKDDNKE